MIEIEKSLFESKYHLEAALSSLEGLKFEKHGFSTVCISSETKNIKQGRDMALQGVQK